MSPPSNEAGHQHEGDIHPQQVGTTSPQQKSEAPAIKLKGRMIPLSETAIFEGMLTQSDLDRCASEISSHVPEKERDAMIEIKVYIAIQPPFEKTGKPKVSRYEMRTCDELHRSQVFENAKGSHTIVCSRMGVLTVSSGLVNRTHQQRDHRLLQPDSDYVGSDFGFTDAQWRWLCIPGVYNPWTDQRPRTPPVRNTNALKKKADALKKRIAALKQVSMITLPTCTPCGIILTRRRLSRRPAPPQPPRSPSPTSSPRSRVRD